MTAKEESKGKETVSSERSRRESEDETRQGRRRWSAKRKQEVVLRLLRGEDLETLSRELNVTIAQLSSWREDFLSGGIAQLKSRSSSQRDREIQQLQRKLGEVTMELELVREKARRLEEGAPDFPWRRSRR